MENLEVILDTCLSLSATNTSQICDFHFLNSSWANPASNSLPALCVTNVALPSTLDLAQEWFTIFHKRKLDMLKMCLKSSLQFSRGKKFTFHNFGPKALLYLTAQLGTTENTKDALVQGQFLHFCSVFSSLSPANSSSHFFLPFLVSLSLLHHSH